MKHPSRSLPRDCLLWSLPRSPYQSDEPVGDPGSFLLQLEFVDRKVLVSLSFHVGFSEFPDVRKFSDEELIANEIRSSNSEKYQYETITLYNTPNNKLEEEKQLSACYDLSRGVTFSPTQQCFSAFAWLINTLYE
ncbi:hypothetical protein J6590_087719 [Homalodisca vitripennis]|nr:hypothetical protein J6590_087719 [Homalodisca vitripennis]